MTSPIEEYLTADKAAAILDVTPQMIRKLCRGRELPFYRVGRCIRIARPDFERYLANQRVGRQVSGIGQSTNAEQRCSGSTRLTVAQAQRAC